MMLCGAFEEGEGEKLCFWADTLDCKGCVGEEKVNETRKVQALLLFIAGSEAKSSIFHVALRLPLALCPPNTQTKQEVFATAQHLAANREDIVVNLKECSSSIIVEAGTSSQTQQRTSIQGDIASSEFDDHRKSAYQCGSMLSCCICEYISEERIVLLDETCLAET